MAALGLAIFLLALALARGPEAPGRPAPAYTPPAPRASEAARPPAPPPAPAPATPRSAAAAPAASPGSGATAIGELHLTAAGVHVDAQVVRFGPR
jgi:hypothetical protein